MGRPKLSSLSCAICKIKFKKKQLLNEHMKNHSSSKQLRKRLNYCHACHKSLNPQSCEIYIQKQPEAVFYNKKNCNENGLAVLSKKKINKKIDLPQQKTLGVEEIKTEAADNEDSDWSEQLKTENKKVDLPQQKTLGVEEIKTEPADNEDSDWSEQLKTESKKKINKKGDLPQQKTLTVGEIKVEDSDWSEQQCDIKPDIRICGVQNQSANLFNIISNCSTALNFGSFISPVNQPNAQFLQSLSNQPIIVHQTDNILKFDCSSEKYSEWLKNFASTCKTYNFPLSPEVCKKISQVAREIRDALSCYDLFVNQKEKHSYFMKMYGILSEIMLKHMQHVCDVDK